MKKTHLVEHKSETKSKGQVYYDAKPSRVTRWEKLTKAAQAMYEGKAAAHGIE
jgi:hypothetical protein